MLGTTPQSLTRLFIIVACCTAATLLICNGPAVATDILRDDFDEVTTNPTPTTLSDRVAPTGQTWVGFDHFEAGGSFTLDPNFGTAGTIGAGGPHNAGNSIPLNTTLTTGTVRLSLDVVTNSPASRKPQMWFTGAEGNNMSYQWEAESPGSPLFFEFSGPLKNPDFQNMGIDTGLTPGAAALHVDLDWDLDNQTLTVSWHDVHNPTTSGSQLYGTYSNVWKPTRLHIWQNIAGAGDNGFDNVLVEIGGPAPSPPTEFTWNAADGGNWNWSPNWMPALVPGNGTRTLLSYEKVIFGDSISSTSTVFTDLPRTLNSVQFDNPTSYIIAGGGGVNLVATTAASPVAPTIGVAAGNHQFQAAVSILADTTVTLVDGTQLEMVNRLNLNNNTLTKSGDGTLLINSSFNMGGGTIVNNSGVIGGGGTVGGSVSNTGGIVAPGNSPGILTVTDNYTNGPGGTLEIEIMDTSPGEDSHDQMLVGATATLDGTLDIQDDGFTPVVDETPGTIGVPMVIMTAANVNGEFSTINGKHVGGGIFYDVAYNTNNVTLGAFQAAKGDTDGDFDVDITDFNKLAANYDPIGMAMPAHDWTEGNFDADPDVDLTDFNDLATNFGEYGRGPGQVPEPTSWALAAMAILAATSLMDYRWRRRDHCAENDNFKIPIVPDQSFCQAPTYRVASRHHSANIFDHPSQTDRPVRVGGR